MKKLTLAALSLALLALPLMGLAESGHGETAGGGGLLESLGIDWQVILIQFLGFLIVLFVLWKFAFSKIGSVLDARRDDIQNRMETLEADQQRLDQLNAETAQRLNEIQVEAQRKLQQAVEEANRERERLVAEAREEAGQELERARERIQQERDAAILELRAVVADLAIAATNKILNTDLDDKRHRQLVDDFIAAMPSQPVEQD